MSDGRRCTVLLLDDRSLDFLVKPRLLAGDLFDIVASNFNLHEKEYFGLSHQDEHGNRKWLRLEKRVLDHSFQKSVCIKLVFGVRFYIPTISQLKENTTVELFFLQAKSMISSGELDCDCATVFVLAATVLQATYGDYVSEAIARDDIRKLAILPVKTLSEHPSLEVCEDGVISHYRSMSGVLRGEAIVSYMNIVERLPMYGVHYYEAKDKSSIPCYLGLSYRGIGQFDLADKRIPRRTFLWNQMENLYYRDKKFSIEVRDVTQSPSNHSVNRVSSLRRNLTQNVNIVTWLMSAASLCRSAWIMAVSQHQFHVERRTDTRNLKQRSLKEIAKDLSRSDSSLALSFISDISDSVSDSTSFSFDGVDSGRASASMIPPERDAFVALSFKKERLELLLQEKLDYLRHLCVEEAKLTGKLPPETPGSHSVIVEPYRRKIGTSFEFSEVVLAAEGSTVAHSQEAAQRDHEIQRQICRAAQRLAVDVSISKRVRKERKMAYRDAVIKLKLMEQRLAFGGRDDPGKATWSENGSVSSNFSNDGTQEFDSMGPVDEDSLSRFCGNAASTRLAPADACSVGDSPSNGADVWRSPVRNSSSPTRHDAALNLTSKRCRSSSIASRSRRGLSATSEELLIEGRSQQHSSATQFVMGEFGNSGIYHNIGLSSRGKSPGAGSSTNSLSHPPASGSCTPTQGYLDAGDRPANHRSHSYLTDTAHEREAKSASLPPRRISALGSDNSLQWVNGVADETLV